MTKRGKPVDRCGGCRQTMPVEEMFRMRSKALFCGPCSRGGGVRAVPLRTFGPSSSPHPVPDSVVADLLRRGGELRAAGAEGARATRLAYHEAGHAVVAFALGIPLQRVEIDVHGGSGITERGNGGDMWTVEDAACWLYSGQAAEVLRFGYSRGAVDDDEVLRDLAAVARGGVLDQAHAHAKHLLSANWAAVQALAGELIRRRDLDSYEIETVLAGRMRRGPAGPERRSAPVTTARSRTVAIRDEVFENRSEPVWSDTLAAIAAELGTTTAVVQEAFNARCRRKYGLDEHRSYVRDFPFTPTA